MSQKNTILDSTELKKHMSDKGTIILPKGIGDVRPAVKQDMYTDPLKAHQSFHGIRYIQAIGGEVVLRGRDGQRDMIYPLHRAVKQFFHMGLFYERLRKVSPMLVSQFKDVIQDFGAKILQAVKIREATNEPLPPTVTKDKIEKIKLYLATDCGSKNIR